jgi:hypothetical protein
MEEDDAVPVDYSAKAASGRSTSQASGRGGAGGMSQVSMHSSTAADVLVGMSMMQDGQQAWGEHQPN